MKWILLVILLTGCEKMKLFHAQNKNETGWLIPSADGTTGNDVYFRGDSITWGVGATTTADRWTSLLSASKGWSEQNFNYSGYVISNPGACVIRPQWDFTTIPNKTTSMKYLFIAFGVNDHFLADSNINASQYQAAIEAAIDHAVGTKGWQNRRIIILPPYFTNADNRVQANYCFPPTITDATRKANFVASAKAAANSRGANYYDVYQRMADNGGNSLTTDGIHPNDAGYIVIANGLNSYIL
jgi:lysophospholipase L1-like esterase